MKKVLFVCHGNICRSPMAEFVFKDMVQEAGATWTGPARGYGADDTEADFVIASAATSTEELGNPVYPPAKRQLAANGIGTAGNDLGVRNHSAHQITRKEYDYYDLIVCMDENNLRNLKRVLRLSDDEWRAARGEAADGRGAPAGAGHGTGALPKVSLLLEYAPAEYLSQRSSYSRFRGTDPDLEVADPWYTGNFDATWNDVNAGCSGLLELLLNDNR